MLCTWYNEIRAAIRIIESLSVLRDVLKKDEFAVNVKNEKDEFVVKCGYKIDDFCTKIKYVQ